MAGNTPQISSEREIPDNLKPKDGKQHHGNSGEKNSTSPNGFEVVSLQARKLGLAIPQRR